MSNVRKAVIVHNPLIRRYRYSLLRPSQFWIYMTIYITVTALLLFINYSVHQLAPYSDTNLRLYRNIYSQLLMIQVVILWIWAALNCRLALGTEVSEKTYDFFRLLPLSAVQKAAGILIGRNLLPLIFGTVNLILVLIFGLLAEISAFLQLQIILLLLSASVFINLLSLLSFNTTTKKHARTSIVVWIILIIFFGPMLLPSVFLSSHALSQIDRLENHLVQFYNVKIQVLLLITCLCLYLSFWNILGILRRFIFENEPLFSRKAALLFLLGYGFITLGLFLPHLSEGTMLVYVFWLISMVPVAIVPVGSMKTFDHYLEYCGVRRTGSGLRGGMVFTLLLNSNLTLALGLFSIWAVFASVVAVFSGVEVSLFVFDIIVIFSFYLFLLFMLELYVVYCPVFSKINLLLGFVTILYLFLPLLLSITLDMPDLRFFSPLGFFTYITKSSQVENYIIHAQALVVNMLLCVIPAGLILKRYFDIFALRRKMENINAGKLAKS